MKHKKAVARSRKRSRQALTGARRKSKRKGLSLSAAAETGVSMREVMEFYKPIKKPVTLRVDADVLAWFKRDGRRYQTRINAALRRVMEREMRHSGV